MFPLSGPVAGFSPALIAAIAAGYLIGSIPFGLVLTRMAGLGDIRRIGSGNIGATNVLAATLLLDVGKGALVVLVVSRNWGFVGLMDAGLFAGLATVLGHNFPVWLKFRGGKGVATTMGVLLGSLFPVGAVACGAWLLTAAVFRYSSLAALVALTAAPVYAAWIGATPVALAAGALTLLSIFTHRANIERLIQGQEPKIGGGKTGT